MSPILRGCLSGNYVYSISKFTARSITGFQKSSNFNIFSSISDKGKHLKEERKMSFGINKDLPKQGQKTMKRHSSSIPSTPGAAGVQSRLNITSLTESSRLDLEDKSEPEVFQRSIENYIGTVKVPVGLIEVSVNGRHAKGDYLVPMATTEAALVASYNRGSSLIREAGGCNVVALSQTINRVPSFQFQNINQALDFVNWINNNHSTLKHVGDSTSGYGRLTDLECNVLGSRVDVRMSFSTGDAAGQNICTIATEAICEEILKTCQVQPEIWYIETGGSSDKRASYGSVLKGRGIRVAGEVIIPKGLLQSRVRTTPDQMVELARHLSSNCVLNGTIGCNVQAANGLAAVFIACGQDPACLVESHVAMTEFRKTLDGDLQVSMTIPCLIVGTVGGATSLPSQKACFDIIGLHGKGNVMSFAEVVLAACMGGEISVLAAVISNEFARAHKMLARGWTNTEKLSQLDQTDTNTI